VSHSILRCKNLKPNRADRRPLKRRKLLLNNISNMGVSPYNIEHKSITSGLTCASCERAFNTQSSIINCSMWGRKHHPEEWMLTWLWQLSRYHMYDMFANMHTCSITRPPIFIRRLRRVASQTPGRSKAEITGRRWRDNLQWSTWGLCTLW
jgi:hypothetical protein